MLTKAMSERNLLEKYEIGGNQLNLDGNYQDPSTVEISRSPINSKARGEGGDISTDKNKQTGPKLAEFHRSISMGFISSLVIWNTSNPTVVELNVHNGTRGLGFSITGIKVEFLIFRFSEIDLVGLAELDIRG